MALQEGMDAERESLGDRLRFVFPRDMEAALPGRSFDTSQYAAATSI
jgi:hypothetical protein